MHKLSSKVSAKRSAAPSLYLHNPQLSLLQYYTSDQHDTEQGRKTIIISQICIEIKQLAAADKKIRYISFFLSLIGTLIHKGSDKTITLDITILGMYLYTISIVTLFKIGAYFKRNYRKIMAK